jgi:hypothetical protein
MKSPSVLAAIVTGIFGVGAAHADTPPKEILKSWPSPDGRTTVIWERIGPLDVYGPTKQYALTLLRPNSAPVRLEAFDRDIDVAWSADSKTIAFTDYIGSNVTDCYVVEASKPTNRIDLFDLVPNLPSLRDAHVDVMCNGWETPDRIVVRVAWQMDTAPYQEFDNRFIYSLSAKRLLSDEP